VLPAAQAAGGDAGDEMPLQDQEQAHHGEEHDDPGRRDQRVILAEALLELVEGD
jgi:hypothetical protein